MKHNGDQAKKELNMLATLIKGTEIIDKKEQINFNLFPDYNKSY